MTGDENGVVPLRTASAADRVDASVFRDLTIRVQAVLARRIDPQAASDIARQVTTEARMRWMADPNAFHTREHLIVGAITAAKHRTIDHLKGRRAQDKAYAEYKAEALLQGAHAVPDAESNLEVNEILVLTHDALEREPSKKREAFRLVAFVELKPGDVAKLLGLSRNTVSKYVAEVRERLHIPLRDYLPGGAGRRARRETGGGGEGLGEGRHD